jgi:hypothetical protein
MLCNGATTNLSGTGNGTFKWYLNGVLKDSGVSITSGLTGSWWAILKDSVGCTDTSNVIQIGNYPIPVKPQLIQNTGTNDVVCNISGKAYSWRNNGVADTAFNGKKTITIAKDGYYQVSYQDSNGCWSTWSDSLNVKYMGVGLISGRQACIYPNPASEKLYIRLMEFSAGTGQVCLLNTSGQVLKKIQFLNQTAEVSLSDLPDGIYFISISDANGSSVLKFSVVR